MEEKPTCSFSSKLQEYKAGDFSTSRDEKDYLGCGRFGAARICHHQKLGKVVAKCVSLTGQKDEIKKRIKSVKREADALVRIEHPNIVKIHGSTSWNNEVAIILEYVDGGTLQGHLKNKKVQIDWQQKHQFAKQLISALSYLHNYKDKTFCHGDLKSENVLLTWDLDIKLADFGAVNIIKASNIESTTLDMPTTKQYTLLYVAPEFWETGKANPPIDVYSYGMILYEIVTRQAIFHGHTLPANLLMVRIASGVRPDEKVTEKVEKSLTGQKDLDAFRALTEIMKKCWDGNPDYRPTAKEILENLKENPVKFADETKLQQAFKSSPKVFETQHPTKLTNFTQPFIVATNQQIRAVPFASVLPKFGHLHYGGNNEAVVAEQRSLKQRRKQSEAITLYEQAREARIHAEELHKKQEEQQRSAEQAQQAPILAEEFHKELEEVQRLVEQYKKQLLRLDR